MIQIPNLNNNTSITYSTQNTWDYISRIYHHSNEGIQSSTRYNNSFNE